MKRRFYAVTSDNHKVYSFSSRAKRTEYINDILTVPTAAIVYAVPASAAIVRYGPVFFKG